MFLLLVNGGNLALQFPTFIYYSNNEKPARAEGLVYLYFDETQYLISLVSISAFTLSI